MNAIESRRVDVLQHVLGECKQVECPIVNRFTPGLYSREILMPRGAFVVGRVHKTEHQFAVLAGLAYVWTPGEGVKLVGPGFCGVTKPGARRIALVLEDFRWVTFHPTTTTDLAQLQKELTETPDVSYVGTDPECEQALTEMREMLRGAERERAPERLIA